MHIKIILMIFFVAVILSIKLYVIPCNRSQDLAFLKILGKTEQCDLLYNFHQILVTINLCQDATKYEVAWNSMH